MSELIVWFESGVYYYRQYMFEEGSKPFQRRLMTELPETLVFIVRCSEHDVEEIASVHHWQKDIRV